MEPQGYCPGDSTKARGNCSFLGWGCGIYDGPDAAPRATETLLILAQGKAEAFHSS